MFIWVLLLIAVALHSSAAFVMQRPSWTGRKQCQIRPLAMVQSNNDQAPNIVIKKMAKVDPNAVSTYKKVYSMGKVVEPHHGSKNMYTSAAQVANEHQAAPEVQQTHASIGGVTVENVHSDSARVSEVETTAVLNTKTAALDSAVPVHAVDQSVHSNTSTEPIISTAPVTMAVEETKPSPSMKPAAPIERTIEPWTWNMVRNMDDNDLQATSIDAVGVTIRSVALACLGLYDVSGEYIKSPEAAFAVQTVNDCAVTVQDSRLNINTAWHSARELWKVQVSDSLDRESTLSDQVSIITSGVVEVCRDSKVRAPLAEVAQDALSSTIQIASSVLKSARKIKLEAERSRRLQQGLHGLRLSVPLLGALCVVGALKAVDWMDFEKNLPSMRT